MDEWNLALTVTGLLLLGTGAVSVLIRRMCFSELMLATLLGVLLGPTVLGWIDPGGWDRHGALLQEAARLTLAVGLMGIALRLPSGFLRKRWRPVAVLLAAAPTPRRSSTAASASAGGRWPSCWGR